MRAHGNNDSDSEWGGYDLTFLLIVPKLESIISVCTHNVGGYKEAVYEG